MRTGILYALILALERERERERDFGKSLVDRVVSGVSPKRVEEGREEGREEGGKIKKREVGKGRKKKGGLIEIND